MNEENIENNVTNGDEIKDIENDNEIKVEEHDSHKKKKSHKESVKEELSKLSHPELLKKSIESIEKYHSLEKELEEAKNIKDEKEKESLDYLDRYRRSLAEVENVRRRTQAEKQENLKYANFNIISDFLTILDDFQRAIEHGKSDMSDPATFLQGIEMIETQFADLLFKKYGVAKYGAKGEDFDPNIHQAVMMEEGECEKEVLADVFRKGFMLHERVIRPAQVKISKPKQG